MPCSPQSAIAASTAASSSVGSDRVSSPARSSVGPLKDCSIEASSFANACSNFSTPSSSSAAVTSSSETPSSASACEHRSSLLDALGQRHPRRPVRLEGLIGRGRDRVDRVGTDQRLDVHQLRVGGVLGARRGPQHLLHLGAVGAQRLEALAVEQLPKTGVGHLRVGDPHLSLDALAHARVDRRVDPADEEARHRRDPRDVPTVRQQLLQPRQVRVHHALVHLGGEQQRDVDVDPCGDQLSDRGNAFIGPGDLDHQVRPIDARPQPPRLGDRAGGVVRQLGRDLHADVAVAGVGVVIDRPEDVGGAAQVGDRQPLIDALGVRGRAAREASASASS